jgi:hypothetical protein
MLALPLLLLAGRPAEAQGLAQGSLPEVDVALVLAVDISFSMDLEELALQRSGYAEALRSPEVHRAIAQGATGRIAITYFEWAGSDVRHDLIPWTIIDSAESALAIAAQLQQQPTRRGRRTSISAAIDHAASLFASVPARALRKVVDVSGDGPNNSGRLVTNARDEALRQGIVINGLPIALKRPGYLDIDDLDAYYEDCVIGGLGSFMLSVKDMAQFASTIRSKLVMEISDAGSDPRHLIKPAQARQRSNCVAGEQMWNERMRN